MNQLPWKRSSFVLARLRNFLGIAAMVLFVVPVCWAQITNVTEDQAPPTPGVGHDYIHMLSETVNPATGSVSIRISVPAPPGRKLMVPFSFNYDSNSALHLSAAFRSSQAGVALGWAGNASYLGQGGWSYGVPLLTFGLKQEVYTETNPTITFTCDYYTDYMFDDLNGQAHALNISPIQPNGNGTCEYFTGNAPPNPHNQLTGGDDFVLATSQSMNSSSPAPVTVADADGTVYYFSDSSGSHPFSYSYLPSWIEDRNGNKVTFTDNGSGSFTITDTTGRTSINSSGFGTSGNTIAVDGLSSPYTVTWTNESSSYSVNSTVTNYEGGTTECATVPTIGGTQPEITKITLPNGQAYQFEYDSATGLLKEIIYPTGGNVQYTWSTNPSSESVLYPAYPYSSSTSEYANDGCQVIYSAVALTKRVVSFNGSTSDEEQDFSYSPNTSWNGAAPQTWTTKTTVVTTKDLIRGTSFQTTYTYGPEPVPTQANDLIVPGNSGVPVETQVVYDDATSAKLQTVNKTWGDQYLLLTDETTLPSGTASEVAYSYTSGAQVKEKDEYDFGLNLTRKTLTTYQTFGATPLYPGTSSPLFDRPCKIVIENGSSSPVAETDYLYDGGTSVCGTAGSASTASASTPSGTHDETNYGPSSSTPRGNATKVTHDCLSGCSTNASTTYTYDEAGQVLSMIDPCGNATCSDMPSGSHTTTYSYTDSYSGCSGAAPPSGNTDAYLTMITNPLGYTMSYCYGYNDGQLRGSTDENNQTTIYEYADSLGRLTESSYPDGGQTLLSYNDTPPTPTVTTEREISSGQYVTNIATMDGMGHQTQQELTSDTSPDYTATTYDGMGKVYKVTNPYRSTSDPTYGLTEYTYDALGRTCLEIPPGGTVPSQPTCPTSAQTGDVTTIHTNRAAEVSDEGNGTKTVQKVIQTDGLGRLVSVCEVTSVTQMGSSGTPGACGQDISATGFLTSYSYDTLDDFLQVTQGNLTARTFNYDSLSRLTSATNPESGLTTYTYDANGNVASRTQPEENQTDASDTVTTSYQYDLLNRETAIDYSDDTDNVEYDYDEASPWGFQLTYQIGRLTTEYDGNTGSVFSYDKMGRVAINDQCTPQNCGSGDFPIAYTYDLLGDMLTSTDGQVNTYTRTYNDAAELTQLTSSYSDSNHPSPLFSSAAYNAPGQLTSAHLGNGITETRVYNPRLEMTSLAAGSVYNLSMSSYAPNGDILAVIDSANGTWNYAYDDFNRLCASNEGGQTSLTCSSTNSTGQQAYTYAYDRFGNRWNQTLTAGTGGTLDLTFTGSNNQIDGYTYDAAGNLLSDGSHTYFYDAEHHLVQVDGSEGYCQTETGTAPTACYTYDAEGRRVRRTVPGSGITDDYLYDLSGHYITQVSGTGWWIRGELYAGERHLGTYENDLSTPTTFFNHADWLGTERVETAVTGSSCETIVSLPFGDGLTTSGSCDPSALYFTGKERDWETNLDNFGARYSSSQFGRFMSPDPDTATPLHIVNPQRWNMYAYAINNPLSYIDPAGRDAIAVNFVSEVPVVGHEGIVVVHPDGSATYARFGPVHPSSPSDSGEVTIQSLQPVKFGPNGLPTDASYKELAYELGKIEGQPASTVGFNYFKTSDADTVALETWIQNWKTTNAPDYDVLSSNCAAFCIAGLVVGHAIENKNISLIPNRLFTLLSQVADETWTWQGRQDNREPHHNRPKVAPCLKRRDGSCVDPQ